MLHLSKWGLHWGNCEGQDLKTDLHFIETELLVHLCILGQIISAVKKNNARASLVVQRLRVCLPMQGTRVRALVWEDPTCRGASGPVSHNY